MASSHFTTFVGLLIERNRSVVPVRGGSQGLPNGD